MLSLLLGHRYTPKTISAITDQVLEKVKAFRKRPLQEKMAFVYLDGFFLKVQREGASVEKEAVYVALGVTPGGEKQVLGFWLLPVESAYAWEEVLNGALEKGVEAGIAFRHRWPAGDRRSHQEGLPHGGVAGVRGA